MIAMASLGVDMIVGKEAFYMPNLRKNLYRNDMVA